MGWGAPDPDPAIGQAAQSQAAVGARQMDLAEKQDARNAQQYADMAPIFKTLMQQSIDQGNKDSARSDAQWQSYTQDFQPLESKMASTAADFDTPQRQQAAADAAVAGVDNQFDAQRRNLTQGLSDSGVQPGSGVAASILAGSRIEQAKAAAGAGTMARRNTEMQGISLVDNAARFGRNMPSTGLQVSQAALGAGNNAVGLGGAQQQQQLAGVNATNGLYNGAVGSYGSSAKTNLGLYDANAKTFQSNLALSKDILSAGGQIAGAIWSSKKLKDVAGDVDTEEAALSLASTPIKAWRYKPGAIPNDDGRVRIGRMAEDAQAAMGLGDGKTLDIATENGINQAALQYLIHKEAKRDPALRKKLAARGAGRSDQAGA